MVTVVDLYCKWILTISLDSTRINMPTITIVMVLNINKNFEKRLENMWPNKRKIYLHL